MQCLALFVIMTYISMVAAKSSNFLDFGQEWEQFKVQHNKKYSFKENVIRRQIWEKNVALVEKHNLEYGLGYHTFTLGINEYADLTFEEYRKYLLGFRPPKGGKNSTKVYVHSTRKSVPDVVDWRTDGYVTPIKNQGQCGSCWAFSSTGALEGQHFKRWGQLITLSEQNLVDCTLKYGNAGCGGGWMNNAFRYVRENGGIDYEQEYPYVAKTETSCKYDPSTVGSTCAAHVDIVTGHEDDLQGATATIGPISVAIDATHRSFQLYKSGVYYEPKCSNLTTDHAVLVVGYGKLDGQDYWLVKNSWGTSWGEEGYIYMARNRNNHCAIATYASFPLEWD